jgi:periplasmic protein TonB
MKPLLIDEIVFKDRNKAYGAFVLRKRYNRSLYISLIMALFFFAVVMLISVVSSSNIDDEFYDFNNVVFEYSDLQYAPDEPPKAPDNQKPPDKQVAPAKTENLTEIKLVNDTATMTDTTLMKDNTTADGDSINGGSNGNGSDTGMVFTRVDEIPMFPGGDEARKKFIKEYFSSATFGQKVKVEGVVWVSFIVEKDGSLSTIKVMNGIGATCDNEVINVVKKMPKWTPAKRNGLPVRFILKMPIRFEDAV